MAAAELTLDQEQLWPLEDIVFDYALYCTVSEPVTFTHYGGMKYRIAAGSSVGLLPFYDEDDTDTIILWGDEQPLFAASAVYPGDDANLPLVEGVYSIRACLSGVPDNLDVAIAFKQQPAALVTVATPSMGFDPDMEALAIGADGAAGGTEGVKFYSGNRVSPVQVAELLPGNRGMVGADRVRIYEPCWDVLMMLVGKADGVVGISVDYANDGTDAYIPAGSVSVVAGQEIEAVVNTDNNYIVGIRLSDPSKALKGISAFLPYSYSIPGDANGDDCVDIQDFVLLKQCMGLTPAIFPPLIDCDFNDDGVVDIQDFVILKQNYGFCR